MSDPRPTDLVTLAEACRITGRSERTLRRWRAGGALALYPAADPRAAPLVSRAAVMAVAAATSASAVASASATGGRPRRPRGYDPAAVEGWQRSVVNLEHQVDDLRRERDGFRERLTERERELSGLRAELEDTRRRVAALERELAGGVRGLLGAARRRLGM